MKCSQSLIRLFVFCSWLVWMAGGSVPQVEAQQSENTKWQGTLDTGGVSLRLNFDITRSGTDYQCTIYSVDQENAAIPTSRIEIDGDDVVIEADRARASFKGKFNADKTAIIGKWTQMGNELDLEIRRVDSFSEAEPIETWLGELDAGSQNLRLGLRVFEDSDGNLTALFDSFSQGATGIPVEFTREGNTYDFKKDSLSLHFEGTLDEENATISGMFHQGRSSFALEFKRSETNDIPQPRRPQHPQEPFPYEVKLVSVPNLADSVTLSGSLTMPKGEGPFPVAILISGSGPQDRDESLLGHKPFLVIADHLTKKGVAVLRYDDRGTAKSTGDFSIATSQDFARDVSAAISFLKSVPQVDNTKIGLVGHSEGGLIAPMVAASQDDVAFIVMLAGPGIDGGEILESQLAAIAGSQGASEDFIKAQDQVIKAVIANMRTHAEVTASVLNDVAKKHLESVEDESIRQQVQATTGALAGQLATPWFQFFVTHDPAAPLSKVKCPVLAMNGEKDMQVLVDLNLSRIEAALSKGGNTDFEIRRMKDMNHLFQETSGTGSPADYVSIEQTFSPKALNVFTDWILERVN